MKPGQDAMTRLPPALAAVALLLCACQPQTAPAPAKPPETAQAPAAPAPATPASPAAAAPAPTPEKPAEPQVDLAFLAGLWMHKHMSCTAATGDFYTFIRKGTFSSPALEDGNFILKGDKIILYPEDRISSEVLRKETLSIRRTGETRMVMDGVPYKKCVQYTRCLERDRPLSECNPG
jgi:hypothetical protein